MADAFYLSLAVYHAQQLGLSAALTIGFLYDTELNFGDEGGPDPTCGTTDPGASQMIAQALIDYQATYGSALPAAPTAAEEQEFLGCLTFEREYDMSSNCTWRTDQDQNATWEAARRLGNMSMSSSITSAYKATAKTGGVTPCWTGMPYVNDTEASVITVETNPSNSAAAEGVLNSSQTYASCPANPNTQCKR
jgi:hypothetical protein